MPMRELLQQGLSALSPTATMLDQLELYAQRLVEKNQVMNLTAITEPSDIAQ